MQLNTRVVALSREGFDKVKSTGRSARRSCARRAERPDRRTARPRVIDASGTWGTPNPVGANGLPAIGEVEAPAQIAYGIPDILGRDRARFAGKRTLVVGAGHSAANVLLSLAELAEQAPGTRLMWAVRSPR